VLALIAAVEGDVATHEAELVQLRQDLLDLAAQNSAVAQGLQDQMLALALLVDSNSTSITALQAEVSTLSGTLATLNSQYNALSASHLQLQVHVADHHTELDDLRAALAAITARIDMEHPPPDPVAVFSFTDVYATNDTAHVDSLRQFFRDTVTAGRWVHAVTATAAVSRVTEACVLDPGNAFDVARDNVANTTYGYSATGFYRENNGIWAQYSGNSQIRNSNASFQTVAIFVGSTHQYLFDYQSPPYSAPYPLRDTYHQNNFWTDTTQSSTTVTYTVGDTRSDACGF
jgi:hypothetical protein